MEITGTWRKFCHVHGRRILAWARRGGRRERRGWKWTRVRRPSSMAQYIKRFHSTGNGRFNPRPGSGRAEFPIWTWQIRQSSRNRRQRENRTLHRPRHSGRGPSRCVCMCMLASPPQWEFDVGNGAAYARPPDKISTYISLFYLPYIFISLQFVLCNENVAGFRFFARQSFILLILWWITRVARNEQFIISCA